jgi:hypothetical protein
MKRILHISVILLLHAWLAACGPTSGSGGVLGFGPADWMEITYYFDQPGPDTVTIKYTETESFVAPNGYDPYVDADVEVFYDPYRLDIDMRDEYLTSNYRYDLSIHIYEARLGSHTVTLASGSVDVDYRYDGVQYVGTGGTVTITQLPDLGYIRGNFNITLECTPNPCHGLASIAGEFSATRSI